MASSGDSFYVCSCFYSRNYYVPKLGKHVIYNTKDAFIDQYKEVLVSAGLGSSIESIAGEIEDERLRRQNLGIESAKRRAEIAARYSPLHPDIYHLKESHLHPRFISLVKLSNSLNCKKDLIQHIESLKGADQVYVIPVFSEEFCRRFLSELKNFEESDLPKGRPNTMNNDGVLLDELGFDVNFLDPLREQYLNPLASVLFPEEVGHSLDSHKAFVVTYKVGRDEDLDLHFDNAEVTLNVSLSAGFSEGSLYFGAMNTDPAPATKYSKCDHKLAYGVLHRGQHMHGALPIEDGERYNLIIWMRSSSVRTQRCPMCRCEPHLMPTVGRGDGFKAPVKDLCRLV
ncbi:hypothetical protein CAPTEDRAFT_169278 [Capitella teleta]|uniref:Fe2OG dioxygenase domain-containing protein n=1 Tax=Capitella teleta TaxID=283909 RepID=R7T7M3_CAPTE|nr:hypothetical protein CAPTEDRAFT_169278 [Capitella teleta]|eukprot:ELT89610.1 hypothetical protein CAPTEDRAFT_169278 [Capitella teleta]